MNTSLAVLTQIIIASVTDRRTDSGQISIAVRAWTVKPDEE